MPTTEFVALGVAGISVVGLTLTSVLTGFFQRATARAQILKDLRLAEINAHIQSDKIVRERFEAFFAEICDLLSQPTDTLEPVPTHIRLGKCRKAAYALLAHAGPQLAMAAMNMTEAISKAYDDPLIGDKPEVMQNVSAATASLTTAFMKEVVQLKNAKAEKFTQAIKNA